MTAEVGAAGSTRARPRLISMWSGPRNVSTAMMYSWRQRSDSVVVDEPWYARYLVISGVDHPDRELAIASQPTDPTEIIDGLLEPCPRPVRFLKNMAHHLVGFDLSELDSVLALSDNFLLVRDPRDMLPSLMARLGRVPTIDQTGLELQMTVYERLAAAGSPPPVVVTSSLLRDPRRVLSALCDQLDLEFEEGVLSWPSGPKPEDGVWARHWYAGVHASTGFGRHEPKTGPIEPELADLLERCRLPFDRLASVAV
jgi:hypothetical protein